jgi:peptide-methionine (R)-S-oxide reductase
MRNPRKLLLVAALPVALLALNCDAFVLNNVKRSTQTVRHSTEDDIEMRTYNPLRLLVLKAGFTEPMYSSPLNGEKREGSYSCAFCGNILFDSNSKYDSKSGWPSFWRSDREGAMDYKREFDGRLECRCGKCKSHLGHVFPDGPRFAEQDEALVQSMPASDPRARERLPRFCINGASLKFNLKEE